MSYLVDALKKAERERHQRPAADMQSISASEVPMRRAGASMVLRAVFVALVVCNIALLVYLLDSGSDPASATADRAREQVAATAADGPVQQPSVEERSVMPFQAPGAPEAGRASDPATPELSRFDEAGNGSRPERDPAPGRVAYARERLDRSPSAGGESARPGPGTTRDRPQIEINGHLYSSVPGRSFVLVNGRRYHEGERLAAGPAIESIDARGATLNFHGQRYHVDGPG